MGAMSDPHRYVRKRSISPRPKAIRIATPDIDPNRHARKQSESLLENRTPKRSESLCHENLFVIMMFFLWRHHVAAPSLISLIGCPAQLLSCIAWLCNAPKFTGRLPSSCLRFASAAERSGNENGPRNRQNTVQVDPRVRRQNGGHLRPAARRPPVQVVSLLGRACAAPGARAARR